MQQLGYSEILIIVQLLAGSCFAVSILAGSAFYVFHFIGFKTAIQIVKL